MAIHWSSTLPLVFEDPTSFKGKRKFCFENILARYKWPGRKLGCKMTYPTLAKKKNPASDKCFCFLSITSFVISMYLALKILRGLLWMTYLGFLGAVFPLTFVSLLSLIYVGTEAQNTANPREKGQLLSAFQIWMKRNARNFNAILRFTKIALQIKTVLLG